MKKLIACFCLVCATYFSFSQSALPQLDKSPMDESYCPANYPVLKIQDKVTDAPIARIVYSRPQKNGRIIFGDLIEYGKVWRLGANEATELELYQSAKIGNTKLKKGRYTLYAIPTEEKWTLIINKENDTWGSFRYDSKNDVARMDVPIEKLADPVEIFTIVFEKNEGGYLLSFYWDNVKASLPITL